jgi:hypothetical protein
VCGRSFTVCSCREWKGQVSICFWSAGF